MRISHRASRLALAVACLALLPTFAFAAEGPIEIEYGPDHIEWFPNTEWKLGHLTVTGPGCLNIQFEFHREDRIVLKPFDAEGNALPDGVYSFELRLGPGAEVRGLEEDYGQGQLCRGRRDLPSLDFLTSTGYVAVIDKRFVDPFKEEDPRLAEDGLEAAGSEGGEPVALGSPGMVLAGDDFGDDPPQSMSAAATVLTNADGVIRNSLCVGFDCPNNPTFNADTIRLQENNLRIHFDDTSTLAGFPNRHWRLVANDSASGGANKFSIDDATANRSVFTVEGNAPSNSLYVDDGGRVGFGTSTPVLDLHVKDGDTPALRLEQDTSSGFAAQTWDVAGNETNFFVRDVTSGSTLPFRIQPGASSSTVFIDSQSEVGIGTSSPAATLHVRKTDTAQLRVENTSTTAASRVMMRVENNGRPQIRMVNTAAPTQEYAMEVSDAGLFAIREPSTAGIVLQVDGNATAGNRDLEVVDGDIITNSCPSGCGPADFVFEPDYELMPLADLKAFVSRERHLPNIPSADELSAGVRTTWMQMRLLEKIEELVLYTIDQQERIDELATKNVELSEAVEALKQR